jgi:hypothetical protein
VTRKRWPIRATFDAGIELDDRPTEMVVYFIKPRVARLHVMFNDGTQANYEGDQAFEIMNAIKPWLDSWPSDQAGYCAVALDSLLYPSEHPCPLNFDDIHAPAPSHR